MDNEEPARAPSKVQHLFTMLCDYMLEDKQDKSSYFGVFQNIAVREFPGGIPRFFIVAGLVADSTPGSTLRIVIEGLTLAFHEEVARAEVPLDATAGVLSSTAVMHVKVELANFKFPKAGTYALQVWDGEHLVHQYPFGVKMVGS